MAVLALLAGMDGRALGVTAVLPSGCRAVERTGEAVPAGLRLRSGAGVSGGRSRLGLRETEVHLLFEAIHFGNLHLQTIAQLDGAAGAASDDLESRRVEDVEVVRQRGEGHQAAQAQARDIDEKSEVSQVRHQRGIALRAS